MSKTLFERRCRKCLLFAQIRVIRGPFCGKPDRAGFTLIELLVVIAILGVLAALLLTAWRGAMGKARQAQCISNMRQIHGGFQSYLADHGNQLMQRYGSPVASEGYDEILLPYFDSGTTTETSMVAKKIFVCPAASSAIIRAYPTQPSYGMNWFYDNTMASQVDRPSQTILLAETVGIGQGSHRADRNWQQNDEIGRIDGNRHQGTAHYLFFDGHVARLTFAETTEPFASGDQGPIDMWGTDFGKHDGPGEGPD
jgi:prepilin-type N-terminal cleavage/methylation domain-containing protein/prepilin-type processing-associated H-X9-DG protein